MPDTKAVAYKKANMKQVILPGLVVMAFLAAACGGTQTRTAGGVQPTPAQVASPNGASQTSETAAPLPPTPEVKPKVKIQASEAAVAAGPTPISEEELRKELGRVRFSTDEWPRTDFRIFSVPLGEFRGGGPGKDDITPIDSPTFETVEQAGKWLDDREPVQVVEVEGDARAYPQQILIWHELVNDTVGGEPITVSY